MMEKRSVNLEQNIGRFLVIYEILIYFKEWMIKRKRNKNLLSISTIIVNFVITARNEVAAGYSF